MTSSKHDLFWQKLLESLEKYYFAGLQVLIDLELTPEEPIETRPLDQLWEKCNELMASSHEHPLTDDTVLRQKILKQMETNAQLIHSIERKMSEVKSNKEPIERKDK